MPHLELVALAQMSFAKGDHARALVLYGEALESLATIGDQPEVARVHCEMGWTALKASIPKGRLDGLVANASVLSPAAVLAMVSQAFGVASADMKRRVEALIDELMKK